MSGTGELQHARDAVARRAWAQACLLYQDCADLAGEDLERWGLAAFLTGQDEESDAIRERAHHAFLASGDRDGAARVAFWLALSLVQRGQMARAGGWFGLMASTLGEDLSTSVWSGYEALSRGMGALFAGETATSLGLLQTALDVAARFEDLDLKLLALSGHGQALLALGQVTEGMAELDEAMVLGTSAEANPQAVGQVYCAVISVCRGQLDLDRGAAWTEVLNRWCATQPDLVPYRGQCLVHRSEVLQIRGRWDEAANEVDQLLGRPEPTTRDVAHAMALYQRAELYRVRGEHPLAEQAFRDALAAGQDPQPGLALLRLAQGRADVAVLSLQRALAETRVVFLRARLLPALVEAALAAGDLELAARTVDDLVRASDGLGSAFARAVAGGSQGAVALADGRPEEALAHCRAALAAWAELDAPYDAARCRLLLARACRELGDQETADLEVATARRTFADLGAKQDLAVIDAGPQRGIPAGLTPREVEVLGLVATGASNRDIAGQLFLSERTVARHLANIFVKIGVSTRAAATAFAYDEHLV